MKKILFIFIVLLIGNAAFAQTYTIKGMVFDSSRTNPMQYVNVFSSSGNASATDADGLYKIEVGENDSIWFSYLGKATMKYPVLGIRNVSEFDISLHVNVPVLRGVTVRPRNYRQDSLQNRKDYAKIFDYRKPGLRTVTPQYGAGAGFDLNEIINVFRFKKNRSTAAFQQRLYEQERDKFVQHRFNKALVRRLTLLDGDSLTQFMLVYPPPFLFVQGANDYDFFEFIKMSADRYRKGLAPLPFLKEEEEN